MSLPWERGQVATEGKRIPGAGGHAALHVSTKAPGDCRGLSNGLQQLRL